MVKALDCVIVASEFELQSHYYVHFRTNPLRKSITPLSSQLWGKRYHYHFSRRMDLTLNNPRRLICHWKGKPVKLHFKNDLVLQPAHMERPDTHTHTYIYTRSNTSVQTHAHTYTYPPYYLHMLFCSYLVICHVYVHHWNMYTLTHTDAYKHTPSYISIYIYIYIYKHIFKCKQLYKLYLYMLTHNVYAQLIFACMCCSLARDYSYLAWMAINASNQMCVPSIP